MHGGLGSRNVDLEARCRLDVGREPWGKPSIEAEPPGAEWPSPLGMPSAASVAARVELRSVDSLSLVGFDSNPYWSPTEFADRRAIVTGALD